MAYTSFLVSKSAPVITWPEALISLLLRSNLLFPPPLFEKEGAVLVNTW